MRKGKFFGLFLFIIGVLLIFVSSALNVIYGGQFNMKSEFSQNLYIFDLISTVGVILIPAGLSLLLRKEDDEIDEKIYLN